MVILIALAILGTPYLVTRMLRTARSRRPRPDSAPEVPAELSGADGPASYDLPTWSALDDRQLTRLLTNSASDATTE